MENTYQGKDPHTLAYSAERCTEVLLSPADEPSCPSKAQRSMKIKGHGSCSFPLTHDPLKENFRMKEDMVYSDTAICVMIVY